MESCRRKEYELISRAADDRRLRAANMAGIRKRSMKVFPVWVVLSMIFSMEVLCGGAGEIVTIETKDGGMIQGEILKRNEEGVFIFVGGSVTALDRKNIKSIRNAEVKETEAKNGTGENLQGEFKPDDPLVKDPQKYADELIKAVVTVKTPVGAGAGWFIDRGGYIITNNHVIEGERSITVTMYQKENDWVRKQSFKKVRIIAVSHNLDLALLKIEEDIELPYKTLRLGNSEAVSVGDQVFVVGNPMGLERSTSEGIISKKARNFGGRLFMQITAPVAPGNSGGPVFNRKGEVIGVVTMGYLLLDGLVFVLPAKYVEEFIENVEAFAYDEDNPNSGIKYMEAPIMSMDDSFQFVSSDFIKTGAGASCLTPADIDGDGREEIIYADNIKSEIGIIRQKTPDQITKKALPEFHDVNELKGSDYLQRDSIPVSNLIISLVVEDLNGDGYSDIVFLGDMDGLAVLEGNENGSFNPVRKIDEVEMSERKDALRLIDFDGDGMKEVFILGNDYFTIFRQDAERMEYPLGASYKNKIKYIDFFDADEDGLKDIVFFAEDDNFAVYVRLQNREGDFLIDYPVRSQISGMTRFNNLDQKRRYLTLDKGLNRIRELILVPGGVNERKEKKTCSMFSVPVQPGQSMEGKIQAGRLSKNSDEFVLLTSERQKNEFLLYYFKNGDLKLRKSPSPSDLDQCILYTGVGKPAVFSLSRKDKIFGVSRIENERVAYPRPIDTAGQVEYIALDAIDNEESKPRLFWLEKADSDYFIRSTSLEKIVDEIYRDRTGSINVQTDTITFTYENSETDSLRDRPSAFEFADFNRDELKDLLIYWTYSGKESLFMARKDGKYREIVNQENLFDQNEGQRLITADMNNSGKKDVILVKPGFLRILRVDDRDKIYVEKQFNWKFGEISGMALLNADQDKPQFIVMSEKQAYVVQLNQLDNKFDLIDSFDLNGLNVKNVMVGDVAENKGNEMLFSGKGAVFIFKEGLPGLEVHESIRLNARQNYFQYWKIHCADLDGNGGDEILLFDSKEAVFEVYKQLNEKETLAVLRHRLFDKKRSKYDKMEYVRSPDEIAVADMDADGKNDLIFMLDDRIAVYLQKEFSSMNDEMRNN